MAAKNKNTMHASSQSQSQTHTRKEAINIPPPPVHGPRRRRVEITCTVCGYCGSQAVERSDGSAGDMSAASHSHPTSRSESPGTGLESTSLTPSLLANRVQYTPPVLDEKTEASSDITTDISTKSHGKRKAENPILRNLASAAGPGGSQSSSNFSKPQSNSAAKRQKKKAGLQEMLARSRDQKQSASRKDGGGPEGGGLAAFLSGL